MWLNKTHTPTFSAHMHTHMSAYTHTQTHTHTPTHVHAHAPPSTQATRLATRLKDPKVAVPVASTTAAVSVALYNYHTTLQVRCPCCTGFGYTAGREWKHAR